LPPARGPGTWPTATIFSSSRLIFLSILETIDLQVVQLLFRLLLIVALIVALYDVAWGHSSADCWCCCCCVACCCACLFLSNN
jgi:hypothetical protein